MALGHALWRRVAGLAGASSVAAAAYGAHGLKVEDDKLVQTYQNGKNLHMLHSVMIAVGPLVARWPHATGALFSAGVAVFSGSCYASALTGERSWGRFAPVGGSTLILAWLSLLP
mmetsp:Transcript_28983/g.90221  ORF Transcript_28983/g.90221 Transcript_28983/m.90221 type:complete len:115 (+) Transcript_28983:92-436(+)|eukprot:CAMPEP_0204587288 /NCGR_PEP_ID=MMETSP0661-20131031/47973_1 /ASSEMBLY_ACC=CAM_ASM_000606 /TAXON_ID=109239 /ORGANISM="Alexandrium margalefi, Strain AMGDE01CS-322" /LENGTH=114 /DNA_ID=CAMNT_0051596995 /DNA_START=92 /DNA_END=436 /DNA_ORIENTATION=-